MPLFRSRAWQSVRLPQWITAVVLLAGLPLYLRMPLWCDLTLYDLAAKNVLDGGVHYRDVFDTNLPGFVWTLAVIRWCLGFGAFALHCVDLAIVIGIVLLVDRLARRGGATPATRWWAAAGVSLLYPFTAEMVHCQRDTWMALPALGAVVLRSRRGESETPGTTLRRSALEGVLWGLAVWVKPHVVLPAAGVWLVTAWRVAGRSQRPRRACAADLFGNVLGGLAVGLAGVAYLKATGTWPYFWDVITEWGPMYAALAQQELGVRAESELHWFPPWSLWLLPTIPLALLSVIDAAPWSRRPEEGKPGPVGGRLPTWLWDREAGPDARFARCVLSALWLVWAFQSFYIQRSFMYVHVSETLFMLGLWAAHRWAMPVIPIAWIAASTALWVAADASPAFRVQLLTVAEDRHATADTNDQRYFVRSPLTDWNRMRNWPDCWRCGLAPRERCVLLDRLRRIDDHEAAIGWEELDEVAVYLRSRNVRDREVIAWHDSPHAVYLMLGVRPGVRYIHINTMQGISPESYERVQAELAATAGTARFAVSDLAYPAGVVGPEGRAAALGPPRSADDLLPVGFPKDFRTQFPFNQKRTVFRSRGGLGRYVVHELTPPLGDDRKDER